jgi:YD repeat-containing protein
MRPGRADRTIYIDEVGAQDVETYTYDDAGRLVGIEEAAVQL